MEIIPRDIQLIQLPLGDLDSCLVDTVPGTLFLKTLDSNRYLALPLDLGEVVPGTAGSYRVQENVFTPPPVKTSYLSHKPQHDPWAHSKPKADHF
jgi:hypothetical protein